MPPYSKIAEAMGRGVAAGDRAAVSRYLADDVAYTVGARPAVHGLDAVAAAIADQGRVVRPDGHTLRGLWSGDDTLVVEVERHFTRVADGRAISLPCTDNYRFEGGRIRDWRVFADMSPSDAA